MAWFMNNALIGVMWYVNALNGRKQLRGWAIYIHIYRKTVMQCLVPSAASAQEAGLHNRQSARSPPYCCWSWTTATWLLVHISALSGSALQLYSTCVQSWFVYAMYIYGECLMIIYGTVYALVCVPRFPLPYHPFQQPVLTSIIGDQLGPRLHGIPV